MDRESQSIALEKRHVHSVYNKIAPHFSDTRYKAWPRVKEFLLDLEPGSLVADVGCGNGKYLGINNQIYKVGCDCCIQLVDIARNRKHEVMVCDNIRLPYRDNSFDAVVSIAVIHHFATTERRANALRELARICRPGGQVMIYVWAMEQKQRKFDAQDVLVPWHLQPRYRKNKDKSKIDEDLPSSGSTSDEDLKKGCVSPAQDKLFKSSTNSPAPSRRQLTSGRSFPFNLPTTDHNITHGSACPRFRGRIQDGAGIRIQSDSCCDEMSSVESSHFKQLLLPTRSDSVDEVFVNVTSEDLIDYSASRDRKGLQNNPARPPPPMYSTGQRSPKFFNENSSNSNKNSKLQNPISMATNFLFDSLQGTKENISSAIEFKDSGPDDKSSLWDMLFGSPKIKRKGSETEEGTCNCTTNGVYNATSMQRVCATNGANTITTSSSVHESTRLAGIKAKRGAFTRTQSLDRESTMCVIQKMTHHQNREQLANGHLAYAARHSPLIGANQPVVGLNSMTAQGQIYRKPHLNKQSPLAKNPDPSSSSSNESLSTVVPAESRLKNKSDDTKSDEATDKSIGAFAKCKPKVRSNSVPDQCVSPDSNQPVKERSQSVNSYIKQGSANTSNTAQNKTGLNQDRKSSGVSQASDDPSQHLRYYHVFREGELVDLIEKHVENLHIIRTYYDHANWCVVAEKVEVWRI